jgi:Tol biopolymer transport system component
MKSYTVNNSDTGRSRARRGAVWSLAVVLTMFPLVALTGGPSSAAHRPSGQPSSGTVTRRVSVGPGGVQADAASNPVAISANGIYVAFDSAATNLVAGDTNGNTDVFVVDTKKSVTTRVSVATGGAQSAGSAYGPAISADGRYVAFTSGAADLVPGDTNATDDVFLHDLWTGATRRVSVGANGEQSQGGAYTNSATISADGRYVAFISTAGNLVAGIPNSQPSVFVRDLRKGRTWLVSSGLGAAPADGRALDAQIAAGGHQVVFSSFATNLVPGDTNATSDVFVRDLVRGTTVRASVGPGGTQTVGGMTKFGYGSLLPSISGDGRIVVFASYAGGLVAGAASPVNQTDTYVRNLATGVTELVAVGQHDQPGNVGGFAGLVSADGRFVVFQSQASNLVPGDTNDSSDVFVRDLRRRTTTRVSVGAAGQADGYSTDGVISSYGRHVAFDSDADNLVAGDTNGTGDVFIR